jgi:glycosyltransferase involved in cell wall biosynthesis
VATSQVLILLDRLGVGGAAQVALNLALSLDRRLFSPVVCTTHRLPAFGQDEMLREAGVPLIQIDRQSTRQVRSWSPLWKVLPGVSIVHSHDCGANFWGRVWGRLFRVPIIVTHYHTAADEKVRSVHFFDRLLSPLSNRIVTVSHFDRELAIWLEHLPPHKVVTIYNGIDAARFDSDLSKTGARQRAGLPNDRSLLAMVARLAPQKNHRGLLEALTLLPDDLSSNLQCLIVGSGPLENQLRRDVQELNLRAKVVFLGEREDVPIILRAIDLLVLPSHWECLPVVLLEALAARCPIVAAPVGGVPEILDGLEWPLISPDDRHGLAAAITHVLRMSEAKRDSIAQAGRRVVVERFHRETAVRQVQELYLSLLGSSYVKSARTLRQRR